ncbi:hypothetical protein O181_023719 [Austropuccinia psidii MF-1]|uniref:SNF2 N-terminal domain-containing protein n=1 Tax=Austropuccinia psidii MF-1 TaxID=1389203 RepID=A0A9Q3CEY4_9BASI|nr:hypothetical protein [Austropuccinia psidii MF-1]
MHCGPGGGWIENCQSNPTQTLFVEGVFMTDQHDPPSSQKPNLALMLFTWYPNILLIIESFRKQDFNLQMPNKYDCHSHSQCQLFTPTTATSILTTPSYPAVFSLSSKQKLIQLPTFLWDREIPNGQSAHKLWATSPPGSPFNARHIITNKVISSFKSLSTNTPLGGLLADDMGLGKNIQAISLIGTSTEKLITNAHHSTPTIIICSPPLITNWQSEIYKHAQDGALKANTYHGPTCHSLSEANILKCDIVITSYNTITQEFIQTNSSTS